MDLTDSLTTRSHLSESIGCIASYERVDFEGGVTQHFFPLTLWMQLILIASSMHKWLTVCHWFDIGGDEWRQWSLISASHQRSQCRHRSSTTLSQFSAQVVRCWRGRGRESRLRSGDVVTPGVLECTTARVLECRWCSLALTFDGFPLMEQSVSDS